MDEIDGLIKRLLSWGHAVRWLYAGTIVLLVVAGMVWWRLVYESPYNVYWGMLANSLSTASVTKHIVQSGGGAVLNQSIALDFGTRNLAYGRTALTENGSTVTTETIGTPTSDYVRYVSIKSLRVGDKAPDFSAVVGHWAKANVANAGRSTSFFAQVMLGFNSGNLVPMADLSDKSRAQLLEALHQSVIFDTSYVRAQHQIRHGRPVYIYSVNVEPVAYVGLEKAFASAVGLQSLEAVDPNSYQGQPALPVKFVVDVWSHRLAAIEYGGVAGHTETYASYGVPVSVSLPRHTISDAQLQRLLTNVK